MKWRVTHRLLLWRSVGDAFVDNIPKDVSSKKERNDFKTFQAANVQKISFNDIQLQIVIFYLKP